MTTPRLAARAVLQDPICVLDDVSVVRGRQYINVTFDFAIHGDDLATTFRAWAEQIDDAVAHRNNRDTAA